MTEEIPHRRVFTVGHSTRTADELLEVLDEAGVATLVDVRAFPRSRRAPHFDRDALARSLPTAGVAYVHVPELGGRRAPRAESPNQGWEHPAFRGYADHMETAEFAAGLRRLVAIAADGPTVVMCAEALWWRCHRRLIADALVARGWTVEHLGRGPPARHRLTPFAVLADDRLRFPAPQASLDV